VSARQLTVTHLHARKPALRELSFAVASGSITCFLGQVGAGKSTLFKALNGLIPTVVPAKVDGQITVAGQNVHGKDTAFLAQFITLVFDDPVLQIVSLTAEEDVAFGPANMNLPREEIWSRVHAALERVGLAGFEKRDPRTMSGGEQQLLAVAGALAMRPSIIAFDEPVAMLDPIGKQRVLQAIRELNEQYGTTVLIAESGTDVEAVCEFADYLFLMDKGGIIAEGKPGAVFCRRDLIELTKLKAPQVTRLAYQLESSEALRTMPTTLGEGRELVLGLLQDSECSSPHTPLRGIESRPSAPLVASTPRPAVEVKNLHHVFPTDPPVHALRGIQLTLEAGDFVALLGQNGSGKTTLALHLVGMEKPTNPDAAVVIDGLEVQSTPLPKLVRSVNYLFQNPSDQLFCETFGEEVTFGPRALGLAGNEAESLGREAIRAVGLEHLWNEFSLGADRSTETLLSLASVLSMRPRVLIADEPTGGLDYSTAQSVMQILEQYNRMGNTIIMITHDMELAAQHARRIVVLREGEIWMDGTPQDVFSKPERLAQTRLSPPQITRLAQSLAEWGFPSDVLSVDEFARILQTGRSDKSGA